MKQSIKLTYSDGTTQTKDITNKDTLDFNIGSINCTEWDANKRAPELVQTFSNGYIRNLYLPIKYNNNVHILSSKEGTSGYLHRPFGNTTITVDRTGLTATLVPNGLLLNGKPCKTGDHIPLETSCLIELPGVFKQRLSCYKTGWGIFTNYTFWYRDILDHWVM